jgi:hypothetical protein
MKRLSRDAALVVPLLAAWILVGAVPLLFSSQTFSRSRWIAERMRLGVRFSGGVVPGDPRPAFAALLRAPWVEPRRRGRPGPANTRVSFDILAPDGGGAQPETEAEPALAVDLADARRLLAGYQEDRFPTLGGARALTYALSTDGGRRWGEGLVPHLTLASDGRFQRASDPWVAFGPGHRAYFASLAFDETDPANGVFLSASDDGGATWGDPIAVHEGPAGGLDDKEAVAVDDDPHSPFFGRVYVGWDISPADPAQPQTLVVAHSADGGATWSAPVVLEPLGGNVGVIPLVGPRGVVYAVWWHAQNPSGPPGATSIESATSTDGGETWSAPVEVAQVVSPFVPGLRTGEGIPAAAVSPSGRLYVVWQDGRFTSPIPQIALASSADGQSWNSPIRISDGPDWAASFSPAVAVNRAGQVAVGYYSLRNSPQDQQVLVDEYLVASGPRRHPWGRGQRVSATSWDVRFAAIGDGAFFLGDYQGLAASGTAFLPLWVATFSPSALDPPARQPDVYTMVVGR